MHRDYDDRPPGKLDRFLGLTRLETTRVRVRVRVNPLRS